MVDIDKILKYENAEDNLDKMPEAKVVYDDMPPYVPHGWKYLTFDKQGRLYVPLGPPCNICLPPTGLSQVRRVNPDTGEAEIMAIGVRNSVGGDIDPRTGDYWFTENARDWISDDLPSDKLNRIAKQGAHYGYPYCHQGNMLDPKYGKGYKCSDFTPPVLNLGAHVAPLGMKFYTGQPVPRKEYKNNIFIAEHGSWNRHKYQGATHQARGCRPAGQEGQAGSVRVGMAHRRPELQRPAGRRAGRQRRIAAGRGRLGRRDLPHQLREVVADGGLTNRHGQARPVMTVGALRFCWPQHASH